MDALNPVLYDLTGTLTAYFLVAIFGFYMMESLNHAIEKKKANQLRWRVGKTIPLLKFIMACLVVAGTLLLFPLYSALFHQGMWGSLFFLSLVAAHGGLVVAVIVNYANLRSRRKTQLIVRTWRGSTSLADADGYFEYLKKTGMKEYHATPGNRGVLVLRKDDQKLAEFLLLSFWESMDAVKAFAGSQPNRAVFYPEDKKFLVKYDRTVDHYQMLFRS